jgi:hypothetical protein
MMAGIGAAVRLVTGTYALKSNMSLTCGLTVIRTARRRRVRESIYGKAPSLRVPNTRGALKCARGLGLAIAFRPWVSMALGEAS